MTLANRYIVASLPANERDRLAALCALNILDTPPEPEFDHLTALASEICGCPIALVSLLDVSRQWFKSHHGLDASETPRDMAFCGHAILQNDIFEVSDTLLDGRFADNPLVTDAPYIRFYAGAVLKGCDGHAFGTLCVIDTKPRLLSKKQRSMLSKLAEQTSYLLNARAAKQQAVLQEQTLARLLDSMPDGVVSCNEHGELTQFNAQAQLWHNTDIMSTPTEEWPRHFDLFHATENRHLLRHEVPLIRVLSGDEIHDLEMRIRTPNHPDRLVSCNGRQLYSESGALKGALVVMRDITQQRKQAQQITEEQHHLSVVLQGTRAGTWDVNLETGESHVNERWAEIIGYRLAELQPLDQPTWQALCHPDDLMTSNQLLQRHIKSPKTEYDFIFRMKHKLGHWVWVHSRGRVYEWDADGKARRMAGTHSDITVQQQAKEESLLAAQRFKGAFDSAALGIGLVSLNGQWTEVNRALTQMLDISEPDLLAMRFHDCIDPDDRIKAVALTQQVLTGAIPSFQQKIRLITSASETIWCLVAMSCVKNSQNMPLYLTVQIENVNAQTLSAKALEDSARFQKALFNNMADAVIVVNCDMQIEQSSKSAVVLLPDLTGTGVVPLAKVLPDLVAPLQQLNNHSPSAPDTRFELEVNIPWRGQMSLEFSLSKILRHDRVLWIILIRDLSEAKRLDRLKSDFISTVSHELRTPLTAIRAAIGMMAQGVLGEVPATMNDMLAIANQNSERLSLLINDLLDLEKIMADKFDLQISATALTPLIESTITSLAPVAETHQVTIKQMPGKAVNIMADANRLTQVLANLLSNACKYSYQNGEVIVSYEALPEHGLIQVTDYGSGIPFEFRSRIFKAFSQADSSDTRKQSGTGLGLAISKKFIEAMGGTIGFDSIPNQGTTFWVKLPIVK